MARNTPSPTVEQPEIDADEVAAMLEGMISEAESFDSSDRAPEREMALAWMNGEMPDLISKPGKSEAIEEILADAMAWLLPNLARIFLSSENVVMYEANAPRIYHDMTPDEIKEEYDRVEDFAKQATDYVNDVFMKQCNGEKVLRDGFYNGLLHANGVVKFWWDNAPKITFETYTGITDQKFQRIINDPDVEPIWHSEYDDPDALAALAEGASPAALAAGAPGAVGGAIPGSGGMPPGPDAGGGVSFQQLQGQPAGGPGVPPAGGAPIPGQAPPGAAPAGSDALGAGPGQPGAAPGGLGDLAAALGPFAALPPPPPPMLHDLKIRRTDRMGRLRVEAVADEDFLIGTNDTALDEDHCRFVAHVTTPTRSDLILKGIDPDQVWDLGGENGTETDQARRGKNYNDTDTYEDKAGERVEVFECYALLDLDGDGVSEWYQVLIGGHMGAREILRRAEDGSPWIEPWGGMLPFADLCPDPVPHRWKGRSLFQRLRQPQRVATALTRRINDNIYQTVEPDRVVDIERVRNKDAIFNRKLGQIIQVDGNVGDVVADLSVPFFAKEAVPLVEEQRKTAERRVGVGDQSAGLDPDAMQHQVATSITAMQGASSLRKEDYARCFRVGLTRLFRGILALVVENQGRPTTKRIRGQWREVDPRAWNADMDVNVNTGLGAGNRDRDLAMLQAIAAAQKEVLIQIAPMMGLDNPVMSIRNLYETYRMACEAAGVRGAERFFPDLSPDVLQAMNQQQQQAKQAQQQDPKAAAQAAKVQADIQMQQQKLQLEAQMQAQRLQMEQQAMLAEFQMKQQMQTAELQHKQALAQQAEQLRGQIEAAKLETERQKATLQMQYEIALDRERAQMEIQADRERAQQEIELERAKATVEIQLRREELAAEFELKSRQIDMEGRQAAETEIPRPE